MERIIAFHPSNELYGADRILALALGSFPKETEKVLYLPKDGVLTGYLQEHVENITIKIEPSMPIIYRSLFTPLGIIKFVRNWMRFRAILKRERQDGNFRVAYVNTLSCCFILPLLKRLEIPRFTHVHEILEHPKFIAKLTARMLKRYSDAVVCVSEAVLKNLKGLEPSLDHKLIRLHNGIPPIQAHKRKVNKKLKFYLFGRIMPKKGQWYLIDAIRELPKESLKRCEFVIMGGVLKGMEHLLSGLKEKIESSQLEESVHIKGFSNDISSAMADADICLVPSLMKDPFPTTVLEAMSAGKPVIATNHGGAAEVITNGVNGFLVAPNQPGELASAMHRFIEGSADHRSFGEEAKANFEARFTLDTFRGNWMEFITHAFR